MGKILIGDLTTVLMEKHRVNKSAAQQFLTSIVSCIQDGIAEDKIVKIKGLGTFKVVDVEARESVDINSGERVMIEGHQKLSFTADTQMKNLVNKPFALFETTILNDGVTFEEAESEPDSEPSAEEPMVELAEEPQVEEPKAEPIIELADEDEPVDIEEQPIAEEKPVTAEQPVAAGEPLAAEDTLDEEEPASEEPNAEVEEPIAEEKEAEQEEPAAQKNEVMNLLSDEQPEEEEEEENGIISPWLWLFLAVAACAASFVAGYYLGSQKADKILKAEVVEETTDSLASDSIVAANADSLTAITTQPGVQPKQAVTQQQPQPQQAQAPQTETPDWKKYDDMDKRLFYGAYVIIGTDQVLQAREGETTAQLAKRTLGSGMECYIEVYNGLTGSTRLAAGQEVKIPKLKTKKALKKELEQQQSR